MFKYEVISKMSHINKGFVGRANTIEEAIDLMKMFHEEHYSDVELVIENNMGIVLYDKEFNIWVEDYFIVEV